MPEKSAARSGAAAPDDLSLDADGPDGTSLGTDAYDVPDDIAGAADPERPAARPPRSSALIVAALAAAVLAVGAALLVHRAQHRAKVLAEGLARAEALLRQDTAAGHREAASLLEPLAQLDPVGAGSVRAFALAMLFADYRAAELEPVVERLLVAPGRATAVPPHAHLATAALALGRQEAGTAMNAATRAGDLPWARALEARVAWLAGNGEAALESSGAAAGQGFPPALALHGDAARRLRREPARARAAYEAALAMSPVHPRAAYGLAKLALAGDAPVASAAAPLERLLHDVGRTPAPERARAALHLAALRLREGDRAAAAGALDAAGLDPSDRAWAARAAAVAAEARGPYRAVAGAPPSLRSTSDDDPGVLPPSPPRPAAASAAPASPAKAAAKASPARPRSRGTTKAAPAKAPARRAAASAPPARARPRAR